MECRYTGKTAAVISNDRLDFIGIYFPPRSLCHAGSGMGSFRNRCNIQERNWNVKLIGVCSPPCWCACCYWFFNYKSYMASYREGYNICADGRISVAEHLRKLSMGFIILKTLVRLVPTLMRLRQCGIVGDAPASANHRRPYRPIGYGYQFGILQLATGVDCRPGYPVGLADGGLPAN